jgi:hypothetical protein
MMVKSLVKVSQIQGRTMNSCSKCMMLGRISGLLLVTDLIQNTLLLRTIKDGNILHNKEVGFHLKVRNSNNILRELGIFS